MTKEETDAAATAEAGKKKRTMYIIVAAVAAAVIIAVAIAVGVVVSKKNADAAASNNNSTSNGTELDGTNTTAAAVTKKVYGYWGQNAAGNGILDVSHPVQVPEHFQTRIRTYCDLGLFDVVNLAFMNLFGGDDHFTLNFANQAYYVYPAGGPAPDVVQAGTDKIAEDIAYCQAKGVKFMLSLGGDKVSNYFFNTGDGVNMAHWIYDRFLEGKGSVRPFPNVTLDGVELDVEKGPTEFTGWDTEMINLMVTLKKLSPKSLQAVVPECYLYNMEGAGLKEYGYYVYTGNVIASTQVELDYIIIQWYNNQICSYPQGFNFDDWTKIYDGPIVVGLAGDWTSAISGGFLEPNDLQAVVNIVKDKPQWAGFSLYDISSSTKPYSSWNYAQLVRDGADGKVVSTTPSPPQGPQIKPDGSIWRCGVTWHDAAVRCGQSCQETEACSNSKELCFKFLPKC